MKTTLPKLHQGEEDPKLMQRFRIFPLLIVAFTTCGLLSGCGSSSGLVPVEGIVTLNGKPLADATIVLHPVTAAGAGPYSGTTNAAGKFSLAPSGSPGLSGAEVGTYRLIISTLKLAPTNGNDSAVAEVLAKELVPNAYRVGDMRFEVPAGGTNQANFDILSGP